MYHNAATGRLSTAVGSTHQTVSEICSRTDAHTQRDMLITILRFPTKVSIGICSGGGNAQPRVPIAPQTRTDNTLQMGSKMGKEGIGVHSYRPQNHQRVSCWQY